MNGFTSGGSSIALAQQVLLALAFLSGAIAFVALATAIVRHFVSSDASETVQPLVGKMWRICGTMAGIAILAGSGFTATKAFLSGTTGQSNLASAGSASGQNAFLPSNEAWNPGANKQREGNKYSIDQYAEGTSDRANAIMNGNFAYENDYDQQNAAMAETSEIIENNLANGWTPSRSDNPVGYQVGDWLLGLQSVFGQKKS